VERIFITGASRGIGRAIALRLATPGRELHLQGRDQEALVEAFTDIEARGARAEIHVCDLSDPAAIERMLVKLDGTSFDVLVNNAGIAIVKPFDQITPKEWAQTIAVNVTAPIILMGRLAPRIPRGGAIVNILSISARVGFPNWSSYAMSKFAIEGFSQSVREELRPRGVRVINVYPTATATELWDGVDGDWPREKMLPPEEVAEAVVYALGRAADVAVENISVGNISGTL